MCLAYQAIILVLQLQVEQGILQASSGLHLVLSLQDSPKILGLLLIGPSKMPLTSPSISLQTKA